MVQSVTVLPRHFILLLISIGAVTPDSGLVTATYRPDSFVLPRLGHIANDVTRASDISDHFVREPVFLRDVPPVCSARPLAFDSALVFDTVGWPNGYANSYWQKTISLRYLNHQPSDANRVSYLVSPVFPCPCQVSATPDDYAAVVFQGRIAFTVFGDIRPHHKFHQRSIEFLRWQEPERMPSDGCVINVGTASRALIIVFPNNHARQDRQDENALLAAFHSSGRTHFLAAGGTPPRYE